MATPTPEQAAQAWATRLAQSTDKIRAGVQAVTTAPGQAAARQKQRYAQGVAQNVDKWAARVAAVPLSEWQQAVTEKGVPRIATGAQAAQGKMAEFMGQLLPHIESTVRSLPPRGDLEANIARLNQFVRGMARFQRR